MSGLGRIFVGHDERNRSYGLRPFLASRVERKPTFWALPRGPFPLDQGEEGACEAFGLTHELAAGPIQVLGLSGDWALKYYERVRETDRLMGNHFPSGTTTLANMKTSVSEKLISGYRWCFGINDVLDALCSVGPVCLGVEWREGMYSTTRDGLVKRTGSVVGGHFITAVAYDIHPRYGPVVGWLNTWGKDYGVADSKIGVPGGVGWIPVNDLALLLQAQGEAVLPADFVTVLQPAAPAPFFASYKSATFHGKHSGVPRNREFASRNAAINEGFRPCKVCRP